MEKRIAYGFIGLLCWLLWSPSYSQAKLERLSDEVLGTITGTGAVDYSIIGGDTARFYFDIHAEVYAEIDSIKLGYYHKEDLSTRKFLAPDDFHIVDNGDGTFNIKDKGVVVSVNQPYFEYVDSEGHTHEIAYTDNDYYMYKYKNGVSVLTSEKCYVDGRQGLNDVTVYKEQFSSNRSTNENHLDWDINIENFRLGESPSNPAVIDGLVVHLKYDDINSPDKKLTDIIVGTNSMVGDFFGDFKRMTGYVNGKLSHHTRTQGGLIGPIFDKMFIEEFSEVPTPVSLQRDSFLMLIDHYRAEYQGDSKYPPHPEDPTNNHIHTGLFLRIGLDPHSDHYGYSMIAGYNEIVANAYEPKNKQLKDAVRDWWDEPPAP
ncbi:MAG: hypothetical protein GY737_23995 [Desulfobacteraceae bacterium]|nr:hypothetical protein [Desulfobacteraceae bacterium]